MAIRYTDSLGVTVASFALATAANGFVYEDLGGGKVTRRKATAPVTPASQTTQDVEIAKHAEFTPGKTVLLTDTPADPKEIAKLADGNYVIANPTGTAFEPLTPAVADQRGWYAVYPTEADRDANSNEALGATFPITETLTAVASIALDTGILKRPTIASPTTGAHWTNVGGAPAATYTITVNKTAGPGAVTAYPTVVGANTPVTITADAGNEIATTDLGTIHNGVLRIGSVAANTTVNVTTQAVATAENVTNLPDWVTATAYVNPQTFTAVSPTTTKQTIYRVPMAFAGNSGATFDAAEEARYTPLGTPEPNDVPTDHTFEEGADKAYVIATDFPVETDIYLLKNTAATPINITSDATAQNVDNVALTPFVMPANSSALVIRTGTVLDIWPVDQVQPLAIHTRFHVTLAAVTALAGPPAVDVNNPTDLEVKRVTDAGGDVHNAFWTGTDTATDPIKNAWFVDDNGDLTKAASALEYLNAAEILAGTDTEKVINSVELKSELDRRELALDWDKYISGQTVAGWSDAALPIAEANQFYRFSDSGVIATFLGGTNVEVVRGDIVRATVDGTVAATVADWELIPGSEASVSDIVVASQLIADTTNVKDGQRIQIGRGTNYLATYQNTSGGDLLATGANRMDGDKFVPIHRWRAGKIRSDGLIPVNDDSSIYFTDWTIGVGVIAPRERSHRWIGVYQATEAGFAAMTDTERAATPIDWSYETAMPNQAADGFVYVPEKKEGGNSWLTAVDATHPGGAFPINPKGYRLLELATGDIYESIDGISNAHKLEDKSVYDDGAKVWNVAEERYYTYRTGTGLFTADSGGGKPRVFADETTVAPVTAGDPLISEVKTFVDADQANRWNTIVKYNSTDADDDSPTRVYHVDVDGNVTLVDSSIKTVDAAQPWDTATDYTGTDNVQFSLIIPSTSVNGPFVTADGKTLETDGQYNLQYAADRAAAASVAAIADDAATVSEIALMNLIGEVNEESEDVAVVGVPASFTLEKGVKPTTAKKKLEFRIRDTATAGNINIVGWNDDEVLVYDKSNGNVPVGVTGTPLLTFPVNPGETWLANASVSFNKLHLKNITPTGILPNFRQSEPFLNHPALIEGGASLLTDTTTAIGAENRVNAMQVKRPDSGYFAYVPLNTKVREHVIELWVKNPVGSPDGFTIAYLDNDASIDLDGWKWDWTADTFTKSAIGAFNSRPDLFTLEAKGDQGESGYYLRVRLQDPDATDRATCRFRILTDFVEEGHPNVATSFDISYKITEVVDQNFLEARDILAIGSTESGSPTNTSNEVITFENGMTWGQINTEYDKVRLVATYGTNYLSGPATRNSEHDMTSWLRSLDGGMYLPLYDVFHSTTNRSVRIYVANNAATSLTLQKNNERCSNFIMYGVKKLIVDPNEVVVAAPDRVLTLTGGQSTFNGGDATYTVKQGHDIRVMADLTANQQIDTATPPTIDDGTVTVVNPVTGELLVNAGPTASVITITEKASLIVQSLAVIGKYAFIVDDPASTSSLGVNINTLAAHNTGIDFTRCTSIRICITESADGGSRHVTEAPVIWNGVAGSIKFKHAINTTVRYVSAHINNFADASAGIINLDANTTCYIHWIEGISSDPTGYVVPQAYTIATDRNVSVTGGTNLINGAASVIVKEGIVQPLFLGLNANKQIDTVSTSGAADVEILDPIAGKVRITAAGTDEVITLVEKDALIGKATVSIGRFDFVPDDPTAPTTTGVNIDSAAYHVTGIDFTRCTTAKLCITQASSGAARCVGEAPVFWNGQASAMEFPYANGGTFRYVYATIDNAADAKIGRIHLNSSTTGYAFWIEGFSTDEIKYTVPTGHDATATVNVTANAGANTIDSLNPLPMVTRVGREVSLELPAGQSLDWANPPTIDNGDIKVIDHRRGLVWVVPTAAADITYTTVTAPTTGTHLEYFSAVSTGINSVFPDTGGTGGSADWAAGALTANHNTYNPDNLIDPVNGHELNLPAGVYEAITNVRANNTQLTETGIFLDGVELSHLDAPRSSAGTVTVSSTTQPLIFVVPAGGGKMEVKKQAASGTLMNFAFTLKRLPTEVNVVLAATVLASPVALTTNAGANTFTGGPRVGTTARCVLGMAVGQMLDYFNQPTCDIPGSAVTVINPIGGEVDIFIPIGAPLTGDITCPTIPVVVPNVQYLRAYSTHAGTSNFGNGHHCQYNNIIKQIGANISLDITSPYSSSGDTPSVGRFEIAPNTGVYKIRGSIAYDASNDYLVFGVRENSNANTRIGLPTSQAKVPAIGTGSQGVYVEAIVEPTVLTRYDIEIRANNGTRWAANGTYGFGELEVSLISG